MSDLPELKPCPFCGEVPERYTTMCGHAIESNCLIAHHTRDGYPKLVNIEEWNRRADLAPAPVGFSREQMVTAMQWADVTDHYIKEDRDEYLSDLTPAAEVPIPTDGVIELLQQIVTVAPMQSKDLWIATVKARAASELALLIKDRGGI